MLFEALWKQRASAHPAALRSVVFLVLLSFLTSLPVRVGAQVARPTFELTDQAGRVVRLEDYRGSVVVLNFWATWCGPCAKEMTVLARAQENFKPEGVLVLAASLDNEGTRANIPEFVKKHRIKFPVLTGATPEDLEEFGLGEALPATAFIDPEGRVVFRILGEAHRKEIFRRIQWILGDRSGRAPEPVLDNL